jgi:Xaa-Pro aminopeptidase
MNMLETRYALLVQLPLLVLIASPLTAQSAFCESAVVAAPELPVAPDVLATRRSALLETIGSGVAVVPATSPPRRPGGYPVASSDFEYLTGLELSDAWLVLSAPEPDEHVAVLYLSGNAPAAGQMVEAGTVTGIADVRCFGDAPEDLVALLRTDGASTLETSLFLSMGMRGAPDADVLAAVDTTGLKIQNLRPAIARLRVVKDEEELARLRRASELSALGAAHGMRSARPGLGEAEIQAVIEAEFRAGGALETSFPSIVASGSNALVLHYNDNVSTLVDGELLLTDVGAEYAGYAGDVTRTYPINGTFTDRQRELYALVLSTQEAAIDSVRPGVTIEDLNRIAREHMADNSGDLCGEETCEVFFVHGLSHHLGLDVHDPGLPNLPLAPGMVLTVEPGIYIPDEGIGIRIEDDVLVTPVGHEVLSTAAPKSVIAVEAEMANGR